MPPIHLTLIYGSNREPRLCDTVAGWAAGQVRAHGGFTLDTLDPAALQLPAALARTPDMATVRLRRRIRAADAYLVVTPEYNHGYPAPLKQLIDAAYDDWHAKPVAFVSYGGISGGLRAVEQLRQVFGALHAVAIHDGIAFAEVWRRFDADGRLREAAHTERAAQAMLAQLHWWAVALRNAREATPYREAAA
ncbi:NADPH-dependent FMN reductase [Luteimonas suaedae]|uniref:NADPH-dependent FMN reductase n=1 Tax=Luteimonas suaedae TaxID=2605430 RepID=UPI0011F0685C|nr:NADPH-dependent FMN reductase [Luteimonas suaedae]